MRLAGKAALISGGARGMGAVEARLFVQEGARVVIGDVLEAEGRQVEAEIRATGGEAVFVPLDVTREADWQGAVATAVSRFGRLDILVNNAGVGGAGRLEDTTAEEWDRVMDINAKGVFLGTKAAIPAMRQAGEANQLSGLSPCRLPGVSPLTSDSRRRSPQTGIRPGPLLQRPGDVDPVDPCGDVRSEPGHDNTSSRVTPRMSISNSSPWMGGRLGNQWTPWMAAGPAGRRISSRRNP